MNRFKNILFVADGRTEVAGAFDRAVMLAKDNQARLSVIDVLDKVPPDARMLITTMSPLELEEMLTQERVGQLEDLIAPAKGDGVQISTKVLVGTRFIEIIREVLRNKHDLVMKPARGKAGPTPRLFGSTDMHLTRKCPCPVWIFKPTWRRKFDRILAAVDPMPTDDESQALDTVVMDLATSLAALENCELHVVHAWTVYAEAILREGYHILAKQELDKLARKTEQEHKKRLEELVRKYGLDDVAHRVHLVKGDAGDLIPDLATQERADLIIMGTVGRTGIAGFFIGNTAEKVLNVVDCSVLTVKPEGFVTPVRLEG